MFEGILETDVICYLYAFGMLDFSIAYGFLDYIDE